MAPTQTSRFTREYFEFELSYPRDNRTVPASAFEAACTAANRLNDEINRLYESRFMKRITVGNDGTQRPIRKLWPCLESEISIHFDFAEEHDGDDTEYFYVDDDGQLYPVALGSSQRHGPDPDTGETPFVYANGDLVANGKVVGQVHFTDH